jgi:hypothetical protein
MTPDDEILIAQLTKLWEFLHEDGHDKSTLATVSDAIARLRQLSDSQAPLPPGSVPVRIAVIRYTHDGDEYIDCETIYDDPGEVMDTLELRVHGGELTHKAIVAVSLPAFAEIPTVQGQIQSGQEMTR